MDNKLTLKQKIGYGISDLGGNAFFTITSFWLLMYFTDIVGLTPILAGLAVLIGKVFDAFISPFIGMFSDRTKSKMGRRRPFILVGAISMFFTLTFLFIKPQVTGQFSLFVWAIIAYCLAYLSFALITVPYFSLAPELTSDYNEKTSLNSFKGFFGIFGTIFAAVFFMPFLLNAPDKEKGFLSAGIIYGFIIMAVSLVTFFTIKEKPVQNANSQKTNFGDIIKCFKNNNFVMILIPWVLNIIGIKFITTIQYYYFTYVLKNEAEIPKSLITLFGVAISMIPVWAKIGQKVGKNIVYSIGLFIMSIGCILVFFFGHILNVPGIFAFIGFMGIGLSATMITPWAIVPDSLEVEFIKTNERKEGAYFGIWTFCYTLGQAITIALVSVILQSFNYAANIPNQTAGTIYGIRLMNGVIPAIVLMAGAVVCLFYPLTKEKYNELMGKK